jgi:hypothetical protein
MNIIISDASRYCISNADDKKGSTKAMVDGILMRVSWKVTHGSDQASWCGAESVQNIDQSTDRSLHRLNTDTLFGAIYCKSSELHIPA